MMMTFLDRKVIAAKLAVSRFWDDFKNEERGASDFVAVLLIILIAVAVAIVFRKQLINLVNNVFGQFDNETLNNLKSGNN